MSHKISRNDQYGDFIQNANTMHTKPFPDSSGTGIGSLDEFSDTMAPLQSAFTCSTTMMDFQKKMHHRISPKDTLEAAHEGATQIKADLLAHNDLTDTYSPVDAVANDVNNKLSNLLGNKQASAPPKINDSRIDNIIDSVVNHPEYQKHTMPQYDVIPNNMSILRIIIWIILFALIIYGTYYILSDTRYDTVDITVPETEIWN